MTFSNTKALELLGKQVSFDSNRTVVLTSDSSVIYHQKLSGTVTNIVFNLHSGPEISLNDGDFYVLSELTEFKILDSDLVADAFEALITDNKDFIDSLSKPTL